MSHAPDVVFCLTEVVGKASVFSSRARPNPEIGNTNSRHRFSFGAVTFVNNRFKGGTAHDCAICMGAVAAKLEKLAVILGIEYSQAC